MIIENKRIESKKISWILRCPTKEDAIELSKLRVKIDGETENLDREAGEGLLTPDDFEKLIYEDSIAEKNIFLVAQVKDKIIGFTRLEGNKLSRFSHKAEFGICILKEYCGYGIGKVLLENILIFADSNRIEKVSLSVVQTNTNAIRLYKKYGFIEEGLLIKDRLHKDGNYYNTVLMGRTAAKVKLTNLCPVFISEDVKKTVNFYVEKLGFKFAEHYDKIDNFATVYRDTIEFVIVQAKFGKIESNTKRYGAGYDAYIDTDTVKGVDIIYEEFKAKDVKIVSEPARTDYGSYEFVIEDIDGRLIGIGLIYSNEIYFENSNLKF